MADFINEAKKKKDTERFEKFMGTPLRLWFYQYVENFHCKPATVEDMVWGLQYLIFSRGEK